MLANQSIWFTTCGFFERPRKMDLTQHGFMEELLASRGSNWNSYSTGVSEINTDNWNFCSPDDEIPVMASNPPFLVVPAPTSFEFPFSEQSFTFLEEFAVPKLDPSCTNYEDRIFRSQEDDSAVVEDEELGFGSRGSLLLGDGNNFCTPEMKQTAAGFQVLMKNNNRKGKKPDGRPSKNLMAERRRRKRLNDRLSLLRSVVPRKSKMDRTSILGDAIEYVKELLERIKKLEEEGICIEANQRGLVSISKPTRPNEGASRNSQRFEIEKRDTDTGIDIFCKPKPGLLLSALNTLEVLGLEIQQCVISCFSDFSMQASCSERVERKPLTSSEEVKRELFRNGGNAGRCL